MQVDRSYMIPGIHDAADYRKFDSALQEALNDVNETAYQLKKRDEVKCPSLEKQYARTKSSFFNFTYFNLSFGSNYYDYMPSRSRGDKEDTIRWIGGIALVALAGLGFWLVGKSLKQRNTSYKCLQAVDSIEGHANYYNQQLISMSALSRRVINTEECSMEAKKIFEVASKGRELFKEMKKDARINLTIRVGLVAFAVLGAIGAIVNSMPLMAIGAIGALIFTGIMITKWAMDSDESGVQKAQDLCTKIFQLNPQKMLINCEEIVANNSATGASAYSSPYAIPLNPLLNSQPSAPLDDRQFSFESSLETVPMTAQ